MGWVVSRLALRAVPDEGAPRVLNPPRHLGQAPVWPTRGGSAAVCASNGGSGIGAATRAQAILFVHRRSTPRSSRPLTPPGMRVIATAHIVVVASLLQPLPVSVVVTLPRAGDVESSGIHLLLAAPQAHPFRRPRLPPSAAALSIPSAACSRRAPCLRARAPLSCLSARASLPCSNPLAVFVACLGCSRRACTSSCARTSWRNACDSQAKEGDMCARKRPRSSPRRRRCRDWRT